MSGERGSRSRKVDDGTAWPAGVQVLALHAPMESYFGTLKTELVHQACYKTRDAAHGGWNFGNTIDGCQAEFACVPDAMANLSAVPVGLTDEQVLMCPDTMSTGFSGAERGSVQIGDTVVVFAQGPIGL